ncbi:MAG TPA: hypothetical protein VNH82_01920 [Candidatus Dormibacteraeota bacterium]|nr:hypothetical protein [Candidatus Dormibacteraeota bacterium]
MLAVASRVTGLCAGVFLAVLCGPSALAASRPAILPPPQPTSATPVAAIPSSGPHFTDYLWSPDVDVSVHVGLYGDCTGQAPLTHSEVAIDSCVAGQGPYFVGHGLPGLFGGLLSLKVGNSIDYYDAVGDLTVYHVDRLLTLPRSEVDYIPGSAATFQTCTSATGLVDLVVGVSAPTVAHPGILVD